MLRLVATRLQRARQGERGAVLVITTAVMFTMLVIAAFAIDVAIWYVHGRHLQTEADAAALAGAQLFQFPCTPGTSSVGTTDNAIQNVVNKYDGTQAPPTGTFYNQQVNVEPTPATLYSPSAHNLFSELNAPQFENQNLPNPGDSLTGSPCTDSAIDVKLTETNLPSYFPFINPSYVDKEAEVAIENETSGQNISPLAEPLPTPALMTAYVVDESTKTVLATATMSPIAGTNDAQWTGSANVAFNTTDPIGMEVATSNGPAITSCGSAPNCYDTTDTPNIGVTYTHVWTSGTPNFPTTAPVLQDATVTPTSGAGGCPGTGGSGFSNFISTSSSCTVTLSANLQFGSGATCAQATAGTFTVSYSGTNYSGGSATLNPPAACSSATASPNGTWTSAPITVPPGGTNVGGNNNAFTGPIPLTLQFTAPNGPKSAYPFTSGGTGGQNPNCNSGNPCTYNFNGGNSVQRIFSGGFNDESGAGDNAGPILAASINDPTNGNAAIQSIQNSATAQPISVNVTVENFQNSQSITPLSPAIELAFGGNQQNALVSCPGVSAGKPQSEVSIWQGCPSSPGIALNTNFPPQTVCNTPPTNSTGQYICLAEDSGNGKLDAVLDTAMQCKINGSTSTTACNPVAGCVHPNYWASGNNLNQLLNENPADPRLLALFTTDNGAFANGRTQVPIRVITDFYVTGWAPIVPNGPNANPNGDPCIGKPPGTNPVTMKDGSTATLNYVGDDSPSSSDADPTGVLLGHFVRFTVIGPGTGSGSCTESGSLGNCIGILTK